MRQQLDVRELEPPEPLERIFYTLDEMPADACLQVLLRREPLPLYGMLRNMGYRWHTVSDIPGRYEMLIWPEALGVSPPC